jgi:hypothetical protein
MADFVSSVIPQVSQNQVGHEEDSTRMDTADDKAVENQLSVGEPSLQAESSGSGPSNTSSSVAMDVTANNLSQEPVKKEPLSEYEILREAVKEDLHSSSKWNQLVDYAENSRDISKVKETYDWLLQVYPNTVRTVSVLNINLVCRTPCALYTTSSSVRVKLPCLMDSVLSLDPLRVPASA